MANPTGSTFPPPETTPPRNAVDADLFESLQAAIDFVAVRGGGVVRTELAGTPFANALKLPPGVTLEPPQGEGG
jgi:hypothetical protein